MTKFGIAKVLQDEVGLTQAQSIESVQKVFDCVTAALGAGKRVELRNFGTFEHRLHQTRRGRNPMTGVPVQIPARLAIKFRPGKELKEKLKKLAPHVNRV